MVGEAEQYVHRIPVYASLEVFPINSSLSMTGYCPGLVGSNIPGAAIARRVGDADRSGGVVRWWWKWRLRWRETGDGSRRAGNWKCPEARRTAGILQHKGAQNGGVT